ncbi:MAG TPA: MerR family transcriptional regulator, partial [Negativicutes bacterium]|nr:MerR family transcriptional regulator [Negativicutes bacterium]
MYTVGQLAKSFRLSRAALLYYDSIGLLPCARRTAAGYRLYSDEDYQRLALICRYREAGLALDAIRELLAGAQSRTASLLTARLNELSGEIARLREQQKGLVRLLLNHQAQERKAVVATEDWQAIFRDAGFSDRDQWQWHRDFDAADPERH